MSILSESIEERLEWTSRIGAMNVFSILSRDILKNTPMAPLCEVYANKKQQPICTADC